MKTAARLAVLSAILTNGLLAQTISNPVGIEPTKVHVTAGLAEKLLTHKEPVACPKRAPMAAWVTGTVVVKVQIDRNGNVHDPSVVSGNQMFRNAVLNAVRKYKYKPYILNGKPVEVETSVSVQIDMVRDCPST